jgi:putative membrane protein
MKQWAKEFLSEDDLKSIENAVKDAEKITDAEIVPMIVKRSSQVGHVPYLLFFMFATASLAFNNHFQFLPYLFFIFLLLPLSFWLARYSRFQRWLTTNDDLEAQTLERAEIEFHRQQMSKTERSVGVLIFVSLMEHRAVVLADKAIASKLPPETWQNLIADLLHGIKNGQPSLGFITAIGHCGEILAKDFPAKIHNNDELRNHLIIQE